MTPDDSELELYTTALRGDLPNASDAARVRKLLAEAGVLASGVAAPGVALGAATAGGGTAAKLAALPLAVKIGGALVVAGLVATPVVRHATSGPERPATATNVAVSPQAAARVNGKPAPASARAVVTEEPVTAAVTPPSGVATVAGRVGPGRTRAPVTAARASDAPARAATDPAVPGRSAPASPAVLSFDVAPRSPSDEGTLRAETALIERALTALRRGDSAAARRVLAEHSARFPEGQLVRERERALAKVAEKETSHDAK